MNGDNQWTKLAAVGVTFCVLSIHDCALGADMAPKEPSSAYDWTGLYFGGQVGYGGGNLGPAARALPLQGGLLPHSATGLIGGFQVGYNHQLSDHLVLGVEGDASFTSPVDVPALAPAPFNGTLDYVGTIRGRVGHAFGPWMPYVTGGLAWGHGHVNINDPANTVPSIGQYHVGWVAGAGMEIAASGNWSVKGEYQFVDLSGRS